MTTKNHIYFVIPAYNEEQSIGTVIKNLQTQGYNKLIVIDDGSKDKTSQIAEKLDVVLLKHIINRGQGAALKTGIKYAIKQKDCKYIVTFDSDGQHRISDLTKFIKVLDQNQCDIVLGSRFLQRDTMKLLPLKKIVLLIVATIFTRIISGIKLTDTHNGYRVMNKKAAKIINFEMDGFEHASEILDLISKKKVKFKEVPVYIDYTDYSKQKGQKISNSIRIALKMIFK